MLQDYQPIDGVAAGSFGQVVKAVCKQTGKIVAIKLIEDIFCYKEMPRYVIRELELLHCLSKMKGNIFTIKLIDIILPVNK